MHILDNVEMATGAIPPVVFFSRFCRVTLSAQGSRSNISSLVYRFNWESTDVDHVQNTAVRQ